MSVRDFPSALGRGDDRICIAILDGRVDHFHPCFCGAKLTQLQTLVRSGSPVGHATAHGTFVASIIFGQPGTSVEGVAPSCRGLIVPIFADEGPGENLACSQLDLARAILLAIESGAQVINISGGQLTPSGEAEPVLAQAIESCRRHNVLIVAAAGNDGCECLHVPAAVPTVLAVGAMDRDGNPLMRSNWNAAYSDHGILAPGADVLGALPGGGTTRNSGTSFAAPFVSGLVGLVASVQVTRGQMPDLRAIGTMLVKTATPCRPEQNDDCRRFLAGRVNVQGVLELLTRGDESAMISPLQNPAPAGENSGPAESDIASPAAVQVAIGDRVNQVSETRTTLHEISTFSAPNQAQTIVQTRPVPPARRIGQIDPSDCGCGGGANCTCGAVGTQKPGLVYALGKLGYDFGSEARRDSFAQAMPREANNPFLADNLLSHLNQHPYDAASLIWTLNLDATPIYAIQPVGPFATNAYERLREFLRAQVHEGVEIISIPGVITGSIRLQSGQAVPIVIPAVRGMYSWATKPLVRLVLGENPDERLASGLTDFLNRVYFDLRNLGIAGEDRALNYSATNAVQIAQVVRSATEEELDFDKPIVKRSPVCRPDSECYDVELSFFDPRNNQVANRIYRFTIDVSDVIPVTIGDVRSWTRKT